MLGRVALAIAVGGLLTVERKAFLQAALSRPLIAGTLIGLCLGNAPAGVVVGAPLELLFLGSANLGAVLSDHETLAACAVAAASATAASVHGGLSIAASSLALLMLVPFAVVGRTLDRTENAVHQRFADRAVQLLDQGRYRAALRMNWRSLWVPFGFGASITGLGVGVGGALGELAPHFPERAQGAFATAFIFASAVCAAAAVRGARHPRGIALALASAAATAGAVLLGR